MTTVPPTIVALRQGWQDFRSAWKAATCFLLFITTVDWALLSPLIAWGLEAIVRSGGCRRHNECRSDWVRHFTTWYCFPRANADAGLPSSGESANLFLALMRFHKHGEGIKGAFSIRSRRIERILDSRSSRDPEKVYKTSCWNQCGDCNWSESSRFRSSRPNRFHEPSWNVGRFDKCAP